MAAGGKRKKSDYGVGEKNSMNCDSCKHYRRYYDRCDKWGTVIDCRSVHNCFESMSTPVADAMRGLKVGNDWR